MKLGDALVLALADWGVGHVFGVSGANIEGLHDAIHRLGGERVRSILCRREDSAAFMADAHARVHRTLGVCCSTSGGAMFNLAAGLAESFAESVPVLALVGQCPTALEGRGAFQDSSGIGRTVEAERFFGCVAKYVQRVVPDLFWEQLRTAVASALQGRPGPAVLLFAREVYAAEVGERPLDWPRELDDLRRPDEPDEAEVEALFDALALAETPMLLLGQGVRRSPVAHEVVAFARACRIPVATTMCARAEFPNDDPLFLGTVGVAGHPSAHAFARHRADLLVVVGTGLNVMTRQPLEPLDPAKVAVVNVDCADLLRAVGARVAVTGDAGAVFRRLSQLHVERPIRGRPPEYELRRFVPRLVPKVHAGARDTRSTHDDLLQHEAIEMLAVHLPRDGHIVFDAGNSTSAAMHFSFVPEGASSTIALGAGGMGYGVAAAIGAQLGSAPDARTVLFCGDGGFLANGTEIHVAVDLGTPVLFVIFNNQMHGMCAIRQQIYFGSRIEASTYAPIDVAQMARGIGTHDTLWVGSAGTREELARCIAEYFGASRSLPGVLELRLAHEQMPPFTPFLAVDEATVSASRPTKRDG